MEDNKAHIAVLEAALVKVVSGGCKYGGYGCTNKYSACDPCTARMALNPPAPQVLDHYTRPPCGNTACCSSGGIHGGITFGRGKIDTYGYWEIPCRPCAEAWDKKYPDDPDGPAWPHADFERV